jgi:FeS assembly SUF system protein
METKPHRVPLPMDPPARDPVAPTEVSPPLPPATPSGPVDPDALREQAVAALKTCYDPEIPVNIHELGLIYGLEVSPEGAVTVQMTLTSPACPVAGSLPGEVQAKLRGIPGVTAANVNLVWDPPWSPDRMSEAAKLQLGFF